MLWKTHIRISNEVLRRLGITLSNEVYSRFKDGIIAPDKWKDYPHHYGKTELIRKNLLFARQSYLKNNLPDTFYYLGVALHYIQDSYTSMASFYPKHQSWEEDIEASKFVYDVEKTIHYYLRNNGYQRDRCLGLAQSLSKAANGKAATLTAATLTGHEASKSYARPIVDLNLGLKASFIVAESVLSFRNCPALERQLKDALTQHENFLITAEIESSNKIARLVEERERLKNKRVPPEGLISKIKNWITGIRVALKDRAAISANKNYAAKRHLEKVVRQYENETRKIIAPYDGWYNFQIPRIDIGIVKRNLFSIQEIAWRLRLDEFSVREFLRNGNVSTYSVGNIELVRRSELDNVLSRFPLNGLKEYPA